MATIFGWKDILRPIRDGFRHYFPVPDTGPTPEERRKQRIKDGLNGFTYFDTFDQLEAWSESDTESSPYQRANTPLLKRHLDSTSPAKDSDIILIHDYNGNYHDYEGIQDASVEQKMYTCEYLQFITTFIYFSHKLACVPPPTWTNLLHRNGVLVLGTILIEMQTEQIERLLEQVKIDGQVVFPTAKKLARIADHYNFDGWLLNIEQPFPKDKWNVIDLAAFCRQLREALGPTRRLIWYDALTTSNRISYQNCLADANAIFAESCGSMLTNYCWTEKLASKSKSIAAKHGLSTRDIIFGIDVWAQNRTDYAHRRVTYPEKGGGGTNTGLAVAKLSEFGFSAGIFAPAWSYEHFASHGKAVDRSLWEGTTLPEYLKCPCGDCHTRHPTNHERPIITSCYEAPAGSDNFFYTDLSYAFKHFEEETGMGAVRKTGLYSQLGAQAILPRPISLTKNGKIVQLYYQIGDREATAALVVKTHQCNAADDEGEYTPLPDQLPRLPHRSRASPASDQYLAEPSMSLEPQDLDHQGVVDSVLSEDQLTLYKLDMPADGTLVLEVRCRLLTTLREDVVVGLYLTTSSTVKYLPVDMGSELVKAKIGEVDEVQNVRLLELGVFLRAPSNVQVRTRSIFEISSISISPPSVGPTPEHWRIKHIDEIHVRPKNPHYKLYWDVEYLGPNDSTSTSKDIPYSTLTGPFAYFEVFVGKIFLGRAYAFEIVLPESRWEAMRAWDTSVTVRGFGFDGRLIANKSEYFMEIAEWAPTTYMMREGA